MAPQTVTFHSRYTGHILVRRPKVEVALLTGGHHTHQERTEYKFEPFKDPDTGQAVGRLTVRKGADKLVDHNGWLRPGEDEETERDAVAALQAHREYGRDFWLEGFPPGVKLPRPKDFRADLMKASVALDSERLTEMIAEERRTHGRGDLVAEAEAALGTVRDAVAALQAEQAAKEAEAAKAKPAAKPKATA